MSLEKDKREEKKNGTSLLELKEYPKHLEKIIYYELNSYAKLPPNYLLYCWNISASEEMIFNRLLNLTGNGNHITSVTNNQLEKMTRLSDRTIKRAIKKLVEINLIEVTTNYYRVQWKMNPFRIRFIKIVPEAIEKNLQLDQPIIETYFDEIFVDEKLNKKLEEEDLENDPFEEDESKDSFENNFIKYFEGTKFEI